MINSIGQYNAGRNTKVNMIDKCPDNLEKRCKRMEEKYDYVTDIIKVVDNGWTNYKVTMKLKDA